MERTDHATFLQKLAEAGHEGTPPVLAATVILLRDAGDGLETLMLRRNSKIVFGGMWVFPGGRIDDADWHDVDASDELAAWLHCSRRAVYDRVYRGQLPGAVRVGRRLYFMRESVIAFLRDSERRSWRSQ